MPPTDERCFDVTLNLPGFTIARTSGFNPIIHDLDCHHEPRCPHCGAQDLRKKDKAQRHVWHESVGLRRVLLRFAVYKFHCRACGRYFRQRFDGILPWQRSSEALKRQVYRQHTQGISRRSLAENCGRSDTTIARYYDHMYDLENRKLLTLQVPRVLGIDEHFFSRGMRFATTFCDLRKRRVFDVAAGRSRADLKPYLHNLKAKNRVAIVCMDLSESYRSIARTYFPGALVVADRFHVVRLALHHLMKTCRQIDPELSASRGTAKLLQKHAHNLTPTQTGRLSVYLSRQPAVARIYDFKEDLMALLTAKRQTKDQCRILVYRLLDCVRQLQQSPFADCQKLGRTLDSWQVEIGRMWRFSRSNGITEGFHRKMKLIQRRAFGFRNFENYRRRVRALCA
jgi:transposase